jgi:hypothetical protein
MEISESDSRRFEDNLEPWLEAILSYCVGNSNDKLKNAVLKTNLEVCGNSRIPEIPTTYD